MRRDGRGESESKKREREKRSIDDGHTVERRGFGDEALARTTGERERESERKHVSRPARAGLVPVNWVRVVIYGPLFLSF